MNAETLTQLLISINIALVAWLLNRQYATSAALSVLMEKVSTLERRVGQAEEHKETVASKVHDLDNRLGRLEAS